MTKKTTYHHGNLREALIDCALEILEQDGLDELSLRAVARRAGVSQSAPYSHFKNKTALLAAVATTGYMKFSRQMEESAVGIPHHERFLGYGDGYISFALEHPALFRLIFSAKLSNNLPGDHPELAQQGERSYQLISDAVTDYLNSLSQPLIDPMIGTTSVWAVVHGMATLILDERSPPATINSGMREEFTRKVIRVIAHGFGE